MPNHGYCKNCWWWKPIDQNKGICYMQSTGYNYYTEENAYCPDYNNRKNGNKTGTLDEWLNATLLKKLND